MSATGTTVTRKSRKSTERSRGWCFTKFNIHEDDIETLRCNLTNLYNCDVIRYAIFGLEKSPTTGNPHLQGYIRYVSAVVQPKVEVLNKSHWESAKGSDIQNQKYCSKEGKYYEIGTPQKQGQRNDLKKVQDLIREGKGMDEITLVTDKLSTIRYAEYFLRYHEEPRDWKPIVQWFWGDTGTGKTRDAFEKCKIEGGRIYVTGKNLKWWEGYDGHENVIIDDFRADFCTFHELLRILDRYEYRIEVKGGSRQLRARMLIITSPYAPSEVYRNRTTEDIEQLTRRCDNIVHYTHEGTNTHIPEEQHISSEVLGNTEEPPTYDFLLASPQRVRH